MSTSLNLNSNSTKVNSLVSSCVTWWCSSISSCAVTVFFPADVVFLVVAAVFLILGMSSTLLDSNRLLSLLKIFVFGVATPPGGLQSHFTGVTVNVFGWCVMWLVLLVVEDVEGAGCCSWAVVSGVIILLGIFNPAQCATLRRVVPGGTIFVPPYLSCTLCLPCGSHKLLGNLFTWSPGGLCSCGGVGWAGVGIVYLWLLVIKNTRTYHFWKWFCSYNY